MRVQPNCEGMARTYLHAPVLHLPSVHTKAAQPKYNHVLTKSERKLQI